MNHGRTPLTKLCDIIAGQHIAASRYSKTLGATPYLTGPADFGDRRPVVSKWTDSPRMFAEEGDVLVTVKGSGVGKTNLGCNAAIGRQLMALRPKHGKLTQSYLFGFMRSVESKVHRMAQGAAIPGITKRDLASLELYAPPIPEQKRIAGILDAADALRARRREALAQLDTLLQSIFLDMFGDPIANPKGFPKRNLRDFYASHADGTRCGPFGSALKKSELVTSGIPVWNMDNIDPSGRMVLPFRMWITEEKFKQLEAYSVLDGDIVISRAGTVGKMCVARCGSSAGIISTNLIRLRLGSQLLPIFFVSLMTFCKGRVGRLRTGPDGGFTHMNSGVLDRLRFPYPPLRLQKQFAALAASVERQTAVHRAHLAELDTLFASLQSRAFRGDL